MSANHHEGDSDNEMDANHVGEDLPKVRHLSDASVSSQKILAKFLSRFLSSAVPCPSPFLLSSLSASTMSPPFSAHTSPSLPSFPSRPLSSSRSIDHSYSSLLHSHLPFMQTRRHDAGVADLEKVTDYVEEQEIASSAISDALNLVGETAMRDQQVNDCLLLVTC